MKILVLYEELAWYFINCINVLSEKKECDILIFCKKSNSDAPFKFSYLSPRITIRDRADFDEKGLIEFAKKFNPDYLFLAGWVFKPYLKLIKEVKTKACVLGVDNQWTGSLRQRLGAIFFKLNIKPYITAIFVPGPKQAALALKLGFNKSEISQGAYCCDFELFHNFYLSNKSNKEMIFPKRFLYVGRYAPEKDIENLWNGFIELEKESPSGWELWCLGKGTIEPVKHSKIKHFGFLQPEQMTDIVKQAGVFVLPSTFEPWGVVVHEYASAGLPVLCSDKVGAKDSFLEEGKNGFSFEAGNKEALKISLKKFIEMSDEKLNLMSRESVDIASRLTPDIWVDKLMNLYDN